MKEFKGTKGDWKVDIAQSDIFDNSVYAAFEYHVTPICGCIEDVHDARLIAAAPEMLALLQKLVDIEGVQPSDYLWSSEVFSVINKALGEDE